MPEIKEKSANIIQHDFKAPNIDYPSSRAMIEPADNGNGSNGGNNMERYVTHEELDHAVDKLSAKMDLVAEKTDTKIIRLNDKIDTIPDKISISLNTYDKEQRKEHETTKRYLIGTLGIGGTAILVSIIGIVVSLFN